MLLEPPKRYIFADFPLPRTTAVCPKRGQGHCLEGVVVAAECACVALVDGGGREVGAEDVCAKDGMGLTLPL